MSFEQDYAAARTADRRMSPLAGSWAGEWQGRSGPPGRPARAAIQMNGPSTCSISLELTGYRSLLANWISIPPLAITKDSHGAPHFAAKVPIESIPREDVWAVAMDLDASMQGNLLYVHFTTHDAVRELDRGTIVLHRDNGTP